MEYNIVMAAAKRYKVKVRIKVRHQTVRRAGYAAAAALLLGLLIWGGMAAAGRVSKFAPRGMLSFVMRTFEINGPSAALTADISRTLKPRIGARFSASDAAALALDIKARYPDLGKVDVERVYLGGRVVVTLSAEKVLARVKASGEDFYLAESGRLVKQNYGAEPENMFDTEVVAAGSAELPVFAGFIKEVVASSTVFVSAPAVIEYHGPEEQLCRIALADGTEVVWGGLDFTKAKIWKLNDVLADVSQKIDGPLKIDMRYFSDGKIFVSRKVRRSSNS